LLTDLHQHLWTEPLIEALGARSSLPFVRRTCGVTMLHSAAELPYVIDLETETPARRAGLLRADGVDRAVVALSSPIGIEALDRAGALELIGAHLEGVRALPEEFLAWGPIPLDGLDPDDVDRVLGPRCAGVSLPAAALAGHEALADCRPVLARIAELGVPLFVHPGPAPGTPRAEASLTEPLWWRALTDYVAQMQAAWFTFVTLGRRELPQLEVVFAMLAGGAPLLSERLTTRGGPEIDLYDPLIFYDTSSYGPAAVEATARRVGAEQLVYGSDRPVIEPMLTGRERLLAANGSRLVDRSGVAV
jgi:6-methylsalicylate decarboxylase